MRPACPHRDLITTEQLIECRIELFGCSTHLTVRHSLPPFTNSSRAIALDHHIAALFFPPFASCLIAAHRSSLPVCGALGLCAMLDLPCPTLDLAEETGQCF